MGIIKGIVKMATTDLTISALEVAKKGIDKATSELDKKIAASEEKAKAKIQKQIAENPEHCHLFISQLYSNNRVKYDVVDFDGRVHYTMNGTLTSKNNKISIYSATSGKEIAKIKKTGSIRPPFSSDTHPVDYIVEVGGEKIGKIKSAKGHSKNVFETTFCNWIIEEEKNGNGCTITDEHGNNIMVSNRKISHISNRRYVDISSSKDELLCVIVQVTIDLARLART